MAEFTAAATLDVSVDDSQLRQVRRDIERGIGDVTVQVEGEGGGGRGTGGTGGFAVQTEIMRRTLTAQQASADFDEERNRILEDIHDTLKSGIGGGGGTVTGGGGGGDTNIIPIGGAGVASTIAGGIASAGALTIGTLTVGAITASALSIQQTQKIDDVTPVETQFEQLRNRLARSRFVEDARGGRLGGGGRAGGISSQEARQAGLRGAFIAGPNRGGGRAGGLSSDDIDEIRRSVAAQNNIQVDVSVTAESTVQQIQRALQQSDIQRQIENAITEQVSQPAGGFRNINP